MAKNPYNVDIKQTSKDYGKIKDSGGNPYDSFGADYAAKNPTKSWSTPNTSSTPKKVDAKSLTDSKSLQTALKNNQISKDDFLKRFADIGEGATKLTNGITAKNIAGAVGDTVKSATWDIPKGVVEGVAYGTKGNDLLKAQQKEGDVDTANIKRINDLRKQGKIKDDLAKQMIQYFGGEQTTDNAHKVQTATNPRNVAVSGVNTVLALAPGTGAIGDIANPLARAGASAAAGAAGGFVGGLGGDKVDFKNAGKQALIQGITGGIMGLGAPKGNLTPVLSDSEKIAVFKDTVDKAKGALAPLQKEKAKLTNLKAQNPGVKQIDETLKNVDKKIQEVQKTAQGADDAIVQGKVKKLQADEKAATNPKDIPYKLSADHVNDKSISPDVKYVKPTDLKLGSDALGEVDKARVAKYAEDIKNGKPIEPLVVTKEKGQTFVQDGKHRLLAAQETGASVPTVEKTVKAGRDNRINQIHDKEAKYRDDVLNRREGASAKAAGYRAAALDRSLKGQPTNNEFTKAKQYLESNHIGKQVEQGEVVGNAYGKIRVKTPEGKVISLFPNDISPHVATKSEVLSHIKAQAEKSIEGRMNLNGITNEEKPKGSLKPLKKADTVAETAKPKKPRVTYTPIKEEIRQTPEIKQSKLAVSTNQKAIDAKLTKGFEGIPEYAKVNVKDQSNAAVRLLSEDGERARRIALGQERPPEGLLPEAVYTALEDHAVKTSNVGLLRELATSSTLSSEATGMGQRIRLLAERDPDSAVTKLRDLADTRKAAIEKQLKTSYAKAEKETINKIKAIAKPKVPTRMDWSSFVEGLKC